MTDKELIVTAVTGVEVINRMEKRERNSYFSHLSIEELDCLCAFLDKLTNVDMTYADLWFEANSFNNKRKYHASEKENMNKFSRRNLHKRTKASARLIQAHRDDMMHQQMMEIQMQSQAALDSHQQMVQQHQQMANIF